MSPSPVAPVVVIGAGPAGLMAAEVLSRAGLPVQLYDAMPSMGRKFLRAGIGGLNLTHAEAADGFRRRYGERSPWVADWLQRLDADGVRAWAQGLGVDTFVGSSGRVFPLQMKAAPLLRAWLRRLRQQGVALHVRHRWLGWDGAGRLHLQGPAGDLWLTPAATVLALGGASWPQLGSDGQGVALLARRGVPVRPWQPANCGFDGPGWSERLALHAGTPVKPVSAWVAGLVPRQGEFVLTRTGVEGSLIYALSAALRDQLQASGQATLRLNLLPQHDPAAVRAALCADRGRRSWSDHLRRRLGLGGVRAALLRELAPAAAFLDVEALARWIQDLPLPLRAPRPVEEAISCAGGVTPEALTAGLMLRDLPGVFCAGEMLDWEAPTGGYLLTACLASGVRAAEGLMEWLACGSAVAAESPSA